MPTSERLEGRKVRREEENNSKKAPKSSHVCVWFLSTSNHEEQCRRKGMK